MCEFVNGHHQMFPKIITWSGMGMVNPNTSESASFWPLLSPDGPWRQEPGPTHLRSPSQVSGCRRVSHTSLQILVGECLFCLGIYHELKIPPTTTPPPSPRLGGTSSHQPRLFSLRLPHPHTQFKMQFKIFAT